MIRSMIHPRRFLLGLAFAGSMGFGATQAFARPEPSRIPITYTCDATGYDYADPWCSQVCRMNGVSAGGYCSSQGICRCGYIP